MTMLQHAVLVLVLPLLSAAVIALFLRRAHGVAALVSTLTAAAIAVIAIILAVHGERFESAMEWLKLGNFSVSLGIKYDDLAALMLCIVGVVGLCVHVFSLGYMAEDKAKARYFGGLSIFMFSMIGIVLADNLFMIFIFWELVGFSSWLLINHFCDKQSAADASKKAFIVNRVGDFGFLIGIVMCWWANGTVNFTALGTNGSIVYTGWAVSLLLFCGAVGKSAQLPLQVWLPDAMEGPTPVSALIHAATMVAAGIFMLCRIEPLMTPQALNVIMWTGAATALYAALCAITQRDIKKVLAYSTLSQLGYMVAAFGLGGMQYADFMQHSAGKVGASLAVSGTGTAMFHLTTHAFFKALMFLGSGAIIHGCHHEQDIFRMGGLRKKMPLTFWTFTIGVLAIIGMPGLSGFFSKDAILHLALEENHAVFGVLALTAVLTSFYMVRMWKLVFLGTPRSDEASHAHEGGLTLTTPLVVLALLSVIGGYTAIYGDRFDGVLAFIPHAEGHTILIVSIVVMLVGAGAALWLYQSGPKDSLAVKAPGVFAGLHLLKTSFDTAYDWFVAKVQQRFALVLKFLDDVLIAGVIVRGGALLAETLGWGARSLHTGNVRAYLWWFLAGAAALWALAAGALN